MKFKKTHVKLQPMEDIQSRFGRLGLFLPEILLPRKGIELEKWAVIACDQFTQDRDYWERIKKSTGGAPSALNLIYPEVFLNDGDRTQRIDNIHRSMEQYLKGDVFAKPRQGCVYLERNTPFNKGRQGLVIAVDLEHYEWDPNARRLIRCTEGTVPERLPPRMDIRRSAALETTHVLLLIDDEQDSLFSGLAERAKKNAPVYQSVLMMEGGDLSGWFLGSEDDWNFIAGKLEELIKRSATRYDNNKLPFLFAAGDGNHSLATAKEIWEEYKKSHSAGKNSIGDSPDDLPVHPCRYALVEIENIYDPAVKFEPIHRILFGINFDDALSLLSQLSGFSSRDVADRRELVRLVMERSVKSRLGLVGTTGKPGSTSAETRYALIETDAQGLATVSLQPLLDKWLETAAKSGGDQAGGSKVGPVPSIDYIHGEEELFRLASVQPASGAAEQQPVAGIYLPPVKKSGLFETVARSGPLPRKSFSMGEAGEKRFYLECRKLFG